MIRLNLTKKNVQEKIKEGIVDFNDLLKEFHCPDQRHKDRLSKILRNLNGHTIMKNKSE